jgi:hypothetical protein
VPIGPFCGPLKCGSELQRVGSLQWMRVYEALCQSADPVRGLQLRPAVAQVVQHSTRVRYLPVSHSLGYSWTDRGCGRGNVQTAFHDGIKQDETRSGYDKSLVYGLFRLYPIIGIDGTICA